MLWTRLLQHFATWQRWRLYVRRYKLRAFSDSLLTESIFFEVKFWSEVSTRKGRFYVWSLIRSQYFTLRSILSNSYWNLVSNTATTGVIAKASVQATYIAKVYLHKLRKQTIYRIQGELRPRIGFSLDQWYDNSLITCEKNEICSGCRLRLRWGSHRTRTEAYAVWLKEKHRTLRKKFRSLVSNL